MTTTDAPPHTIEEFMALPEFVALPECGRDSVFIETDDDTVMAYIDTTDQHWGLGRTSQGQWFRDLLC